MRLFRALRTDELSSLFSNGILSRCQNCDIIPPIPTCCNITDRQHVNSGSRANEKSRYISTSGEEDVVAWYCENDSGNPTSKKSATYIEIDEEYSDRVIWTCLNEDYGATANNRAKASCEVLIKDYIPLENIKNIFRVKSISKFLFDLLPEMYNNEHGMEFKKIQTRKIQKTIKYLLVWKIWGENNDNDDMNLIREKFQ